MRIAGVVLLFLGLVMGVVGLFSGCNSLFGWNGRHPVSAAPLAAEGPTRTKLVPEGGVRYTVAVQVVFDRDAVPRREGQAAVEARFPLVVRVTDGGGTTLAQTTGWVDPAEPPNVLYGGGARESSRMPELVVERLVGPFMSASVAPLDVFVDLGPDQVGGARIAERRLAVYDDKLPPPIRNAFVGGVLGVLFFLAGALITLLGFFRRRRKKRLLRT